MLERCLLPAWRCRLTAMLALLAVAACGGRGVSGAPAACATAADCHLNGDCVDGACACDKGWRGSPTCGVLTLGAVDKAARPGISNASGYATWGASPIKTDGKWRVFHAQMSHHCGIFQAWMTNSFIARSVSTSGDVGGPYEFERVAVPEFAHNPQIRELADGSYAMFFIGGWYGNFDIILDRFSRTSQLHPTPHAPCDMLYFVSILFGC